MDIDELVQPDRGRVHAQIYTDPEIFREEMRRIFFVTWVYVGHESEIPDPGSYKTTYIGSVPLILTRDEAGNIHVLVNRCVHRGATVCQQEHGNASHFRCEYHAWTYNTRGELIGVSRPDGYSAEELAAFPAGLAKAPRVETCAGLIFANFGADGPSLGAHLGNAKAYLEDWAALSPTGSLDVSGGVWRHTYRGNWKLQLEGSNEGYHPDFLHRIVGLMAARNNGTSRGGGFAASHAAGIDLGNGHSLMEHPPSVGAVPRCDRDVRRATRPTARCGESRPYRSPDVAHAALSQPRDQHGAGARHSSDLGRPRRRCCSTTCGFRKHPMRSTRHACANIGSSGAHPVTAAPTTTKCSSASRKA